jgi:hypothetical protein
MDAPKPPHVIGPPLLVAPLPLALLLPLVELMLRIVVAPLGATIPLVTEA